MGFNTTVFILNDMLSDIRKDPERFVMDIAHGLNDGTDRALGQTTVMQSHHADVFRLYGTQTNGIIELSKYSRRTREMLRRGGPAADAVKTFLRRAQSEIQTLEEYIQDLEGGVDSLPDHY